MWRCGKVWLNRRAAMAFIVHPPNGSCTRILELERPRSGSAMLPGTSHLVRKARYIAVSPGEEGAGAPRSLATCPGARLVCVHVHVASGQVIEWKHVRTNHNETALLVLRTETTVLPSKLGEQGQPVHPTGLHEDRKKPPRHGRPPGSRRSHGHRQASARGRGACNRAEVTKLP